MPEYVDGYVIPLPKKNLPVYRRMAQLSAKLWRKHGALAFRECVGEDLHTQYGSMFPRRLKLKRGSPPEVVDILKRGDAELAVAGSLGDAWDRLDVWPIFSEDIELVLHAGHPLACEGAGQISLAMDSASASANDL